MLVKDGNQRVIDSKKHTSDHAKQYADIFLYLPWDDEEDFLGESSRSMEACQAMWDVHKDMALDLKEQGEELPDRVGEFVRMSRIEDRYQRK